jgi:DNA-directed RNA polymerase subunit RPC12/RpoP
MLTPIDCSSCGHAGATESARLPRILTCAHCGHRALFEAQSVRKRLTRGQQRRAVTRFQGRAHEIGLLVRSTLPA